MQYSMFCNAGMTITNNPFLTKLSALVIIKLIGDYIKWLRRTRGFRESNSDGFSAKLPGAQSINSSI
jgi:hypothetical protein